MKTTAWLWRKQLKLVSELAPALVRHRMQLIASKPRKKKITKRQLLRFRSKYVKKYRTERGWKTAARAEFGIDWKTLNAALEN